jgi:hypothetical protein
MSDDTVQKEISTYVAAAVGRAYLSSSASDEMVRVVAGTWALERSAYLAANQELDRVRRELTAAVTSRRNKMEKTVEKLLTSLEGDE